MSPFDLSIDGLDPPLQLSGEGADDVPRTAELVLIDIRPFEAQLLHDPDQIIRQHHSHARTPTQALSNPTNEDLDARIVSRGARSRVDVRACVMLGRYQLFNDVIHHFPRCGGFVKGHLGHIV